MMNQHYENPMRQALNQQYERYKSSLDPQYMWVQCGPPWLCLLVYVAPSKHSFNYPINPSEIAVICTSLAILCGGPTLYACILPNEGWSDQIPTGQFCRTKISSVPVKRLNGKKCSSWSMICWVVYDPQWYIYIYINIHVYIPKMEICSMYIYIHIYIYIYIPKMSPINQQGRSPW